MAGLWGFIHRLILTFSMGLTFILAEHNSLNVVYMICSHKVCNLFLMHQEDLLLNGTYLSDKFVRFYTPLAVDLC